jgi:hypothetical protein
MFFGMFVTKVEKAGLLVFPCVSVWEPGKAFSNMLSLNG